MELPTPGVVLFFVLWFRAYCRVNRLYRATSFAGFPSFSRAFRMSVFMVWGFRGSFWLLTFRAFRVYRVLLGVFRGFRV